MIWIIAIAALLAIMTQPSLPSLGLIALMACLGYRLQRQQTRIDKLTERLDKLDPPAEAASVALANISIDDPPESDRSPWQADQSRPRITPASAAARKPADDESATQPADDGWASAQPDLTPDWLAKLQQLVLAYFTGGNLIVRIGIVVLFFGLSFLAKFSIDNDLVPVEWRLSAIALVALALLAFGWRLKDKSAGYALVLQGGGVASLYLVVFSALRLYQLLPATLAFGLLLLVSGLALSLAVAQNSRALAITAIAGAFACPILTSDGSGNHVALFSYYALLNFTVFAIAWFKSWRLLNLIAFFFTFAVAGSWGALRYDATLYPSTQIFLIVFTLQFIAIAILFAWRQPPQLRGLVDGTLIFGTPLVGFGLQAAIVEPFEYGLAHSSLAVGLFYLLLGACVVWLARPAMRLLAESFLALGLIFCTLAIPLAFNASWTSAAWAIEGAAFVWLAQRQRKILLLLFGYLLQAGATAFYLVDIEHSLYSLNTATLLGSTILAVAALASAWLSARGSLLAKQRMQIATVLAIWGLMVWYAGGALHITELLYGSTRHSALVLFIAISGLAGWFANRRWQSPVFDQLPWLTTALLALSIASWPAMQGTAAWTGLAALWVAALAMQYFVLYQSGETTPTRSANALQAANWLLGTAIAIALSQALMKLYDLAQAWRLASVAVLLAFSLMLPALRHHWPFNRYLRAFRSIAPTVLLTLLLLWTLVNVTTVQTPMPLAYLPLLNPTDLAQGFAIFGFFIWRAKAVTGAHYSEADNNWMLAGGLVIFIWATSLLLKTLHVWRQIPYSAGDLFYSPTVQTSLSIFWTVAGLCTAVYATRYHRRLVWFCAAALLTVVVAKLFLIDLTDQDSITRIASFVGVGGLLLVVGYFAPLPPAPQAASGDTADSALPTADGEAS